jgi:hypothetical protein
VLRIGEVLPLETRSDPDGQVEPQLWALVAAALSGDLERCSGRDLRNAGWGRRSDVSLAGLARAHRRFMGTPGYRFEPAVIEAIQQGNPFLVSTIRPLLRESGFPNDPIDCVDFRAKENRSRLRWQGHLRELLNPGTLVTTVFGDPPYIVEPGDRTDEGISSPLIQRLGAADALLVLPEQVITVQISSGQRWNSKDGCAMGIRLSPRRKGHSRHRMLYVSLDPNSGWGRTFRDACRLLDCFYEGYYPATAPPVILSMLEWLHDRADQTIPLVYADVHRKARSLWSETGIRVRENIRPAWTLNDSLGQRQPQFASRDVSLTSGVKGAVETAR